MRAAVAAAAAPSICPAQQGTGADDAAGSTVEEGGGGLSRTARAGRRSYERDLKQALQESIAASPKSPSPPQCTESLPVCVPPHQPSHPPHPPAPTPHPPPPSPRPLAPGPWPLAEFSTGAGAGAVGVLPRAGPQPLQLPRVGAGRNTRSGAGVGGAPFSPSPSVCLPAQHVLTHGHLPITSTTGLARLELRLPSREGLEDASLLLGGTAEAISHAREVGASAVFCAEPAWPLPDPPVWCCCWLFLGRDVPM
jgi:hypothetical protein